MKKILITGASGYVGSCLMHGLAQQDASLVLHGTSHHTQSDKITALDITDRAAVTDVIEQFAPDTVVHTVAMQDLIACEKNKAQAENINIEGTRNVAQACANSGARMHFLSTVYVFDGKKQDYNEEDTPNPLNHYGATKQAAETIVAKLLPDAHVIDRCDWIYGSNKHGKESTDIQAIVDGIQKQHNNTQIRQPLCVSDWVSVITTTENQQFSGILHLGGPDRGTKYQLYKTIAERVGKSEVVQAFPTSDPLRFPARPEHVTLDTAKANTLGIAFSSLEDVVARVEANYQ